MLLLAQLFLGFAQAGVDDGRFDGVGVGVLADPVLRGAKAVGSAGEVQPGQVGLAFGAQGVQGLALGAAGGGQQLPGSAVFGRAEIGRASCRERV